MEELEIRTMTEADLDAVLKIVGMNDEALVPLLAEDLSNHFGRAAHLDEQYFVALIRGEIVGLMGFQPDKWGVPDVYWGVWLYLNPSRLRRGIAAALYERIEKALRDLGCRKVYVDVGNESQHHAAIAFHKSRGFIQEGYLKDFWEDGEDFLIFGKPLKRPE